MGDRMNNALFDTTDSMLPPLAPLAMPTQVLTSAPRALPAFVANLLARLGLDKPSLPRIG